MISVCSLFFCLFAFSSQYSNASKEKQKKKTYIYKNPPLHAPKTNTPKAATSHRIQAAGGIKQQYQCPVIDANRKDLKMSAARMGTLKSYNVEKSETTEERLGDYEIKA
jgi:hypothetical protein